MKVISIGPDESYPENLPVGTDFVVYKYTSGSYEGDGDAFIHTDKGWIVGSLSHCSCYGEWDWVRQYNSINYNSSQALKLAEESYPEFLGYIKDFLNDEQIVTRVEVIDSTGRSYVNMHVKELELSYQDDGRTLKLFIS